MGPMLGEMALCPVADDVLVTPGGKVVVRTYGIAADSAQVAYRTWVTGVRERPRYWRWARLEEASSGHRQVVEWLTGRGPRPGA